MRKIILLSFFLLGLASGCSVLGSDEDLKQQIGAAYYKEPTLKTRLGVFSQDNFEAGSYLNVDKEISGTMEMQLCIRKLESVSCSQVVYMKQLIVSTTPTPKSIVAAKVVTETVVLSSVSNLTDSVLTPLGKIPWVYIIGTLLSIPLCIALWSRQMRVEGEFHQFTFEQEIQFKDGTGATASISVRMVRDLTPSSLFAIFKGWQHAENLYQPVLAAMAKNLANSLTSDKSDKFSKWLKSINGKETDLQLTKKCGAKVDTVNVLSVDPKAADKAQAAQLNMAQVQGKAVKDFSDVSGIVPTLAGPILGLLNLAGANLGRMFIDSEQQDSDERAKDTLSDKDKEELDAKSPKKPA